VKKDAAPGTAYGIDFGMSNSAIVAERADSGAVRFRDPLSPAHRPSYQIPTTLCLADDGRFAVGTEAERIKATRPQFYRCEFKRDLGKAPKRLGSESYEVHELVAQVLRYLRDLASPARGEPDAVMCTVPATWEGGNHALMKTAAELAGFDPETTFLVSEPAAAAAYAADDLGLSAKSRKLLIYDLGGGTFDCAVVSATPDGTDVLRVGGIADLGGSAFDGIIRDLIRERYPAATAEILDDPEPTANALRRRISLRDACERIKIQLTTKRSCSELLTQLRPQVMFELTRDELNERLKPEVDRTLTTCQELLSGCHLDWDDLDLVVPVGGSSRIPAVRKALADGRRPTVAAVSEPDLAVVLGAAQLARRRACGERQEVGVLASRARLFTTPRPINTIAIAPDGDRLAVGCQDTGVREWSLRDGSLLRRVRHGHWVTDVTYGLGSDAPLLTVGRDGVVIFWGKDGRQRLMIPGSGAHTGAYHVIYSPDGKWLVTHRGDRAEIRDASTGAVTSSVPADRLGGVAATPDGQVVTTGSGEAWVWEAETGARTLRLAAPVPWPGADLRDVAVSRDGTALAAACARNGLVWIWDLPRGTRRFAVRHDHVSVTLLIKVAFSPDGRWLVTAGGGSAQLWDAYRGTPSGERISIDAPASDVTFSPDGRHLAVSGQTTCHVLPFPDR
jgi:WD40 repeat protein/actin-like ATPase involved in cell morphogenesis